MKHLKLILLLLFFIVTFVLFSQKELFNFGPTCRGDERCFKGTFEKIIDGDTFVINKQHIRLTLVNTPEANQSVYEDAKNFIISICPIGSEVIVDQDDGQPYSYGRIVAVVYCDGKILNEELLKNNLGKIYTDFCVKSEFGRDKWAKDYGC